MVRPFRNFIMCLVLGATVWGFCTVLKVSVESSTEFLFENFKYSKHHAAKPTGHEHAKVPDLPVKSHAQHHQDHDEPMAVSGSHEAHKVAVSGAAHAAHTAHVAQAGGHGHEAHTNHGTGHKADSSWHEKVSKLASHGEEAHHEAKHEGSGEKKQFTLVSGSQSKSLQKIERMPFGFSCLLCF